MDFSRIKRSVALTGLAKDMLLLRAKRHRLNEACAREHLIQRLGHLHGLPQKMAQILSLSELDAEEQAFTTLTEYESVLTLSEIMTELKENLDTDPNKIFAHIDPKGISASLGQVHPAKLHDGRKVAIKVQYPRIRKNLETDLKALGWLAAPVGGLKKGFDMNAYRQEMNQMLRLELNYQHEAQMLQHFSHCIKELPGYEVPKVIEHASKKNVLTMTWLEGTAFDQVKHWSKEQRSHLATQTLKLFLYSCFHWRSLHSDPHPGNYRFRREEDDQVTIGLLDFGCVKKLSSTFTQDLHTLIWKLIHTQNSPLDLLETYLALGFKEEYLLPMRDKLLPLSKLLFEPFLKDQVVSIQDWNLGQRVSDILGEDRWNFRFAGPANLLFFMRTYQGLLQYLKALKEPLNWHQIFVEHLPENTLTTGVSTVPSNASRTIISPNHDQKPAQTQFLRIRLKEGNETKVLLKYRSALAAELDTLVPDDIKKILVSKNIDLKAIQDEAIANQFQPGILFELSENLRCLKVWIH